MISREYQRGYRDGIKDRRLAPDPADDMKEKVWELRGMIKSLEIWVLQLEYHGALFTKDRLSDLEQRCRGK